MKLTVEAMTFVWVSVALCGLNRADAGDPGFAPVPPSLEIEVLDPGVDPVGNPAVLLREGPYGQTQVEIPPVVLVHRYYYSGDRSFQAQILPGGPSIVVANHPKSGERCYIPVQMMPGAPRVTYTAHGIEYDYGEHGIKVVFGMFGEPSVKYRSGQPWSRRVGQWIHAEQIKHGVSAVADHTKEFGERSKVVTYGMAASAAETVHTATLPIANTLQVLPFGKVLFGGDLAHHFAEKAYTHKRDHQVRATERDAWWENATIRTNR
ncbi:MAG: hypothetical protein KDA62_10715 [Planctomycetales bacterium]|nr:hypothetical protein [Planctomycetales bacterium]